MRPPEFTGGNSSSSTTHKTLLWRFNEAAGIHRRKLGRPHLPVKYRQASMRPPEFTGGNLTRRRVRSGQLLLLQ